MSKYRSGLDNLIAGKMDQLKDQRLGLVTNHTGLSSNLESTIDILSKEPEINLVKLFGPEHGVRGCLLYTSPSPRD